MENDDQMSFMVEGEDRDTSLELSLFNGSQFASIWEHWPTPISTEECGSSLLLSEFSNFPPVNNFKPSQESSNFCEDTSASSWEEPVQYSSYPLEHSLFPEKGISELKPGSPASPLSLCNIEYIPHTPFSRHASFDGMYQASPYMHFPIHVGDGFSQSIPHGADPCFLRSLSDPAMYDPSLFTHNRMLSVKDQCGLPAFHKSSAKLALKSVDREKSSPEGSISSTGSIKQGNLLPSQSGRETTPPKRMLHLEEDSSAKRLCLEDKRWTDTNADRNVDVKPCISTVTSSGGEPSNELAVIGPALNTNGKPRAKRGSATDPQSVYARHRRERISERLKMLQSLVPNGAKVDIVTMLEEAINYVKFLQLQVKLLSSDEYWMYAPTTYNGINVTFGIHIGMQQAS